MADKILTDLNLSTQEMGRFAKAMKDAQFKELFNEYAREISEPMSKEEAENYVKMVEERSDSKRFSMTGKELVIPTPDFCFKTKNKNDGSKFFINVCHSDKLAQPRSETRADGSGSEWHIPYSLSPIHRDKDKGGVDCVAVDYVVNEEVCKRCKQSSYFKRFVAQTALDSVEKQYSLQLDKDVVFPKLKYKGPTQNPKMLTIPSDSRPAGVDAGNMSAHPPNKNGAQRDEKLEAAQQNTNGSREVKRDKEAGVLLPEPPFDIIYRSGLDLSNFWMYSNFECTKESEKPKEIVLRVCLPEVMSASEVELDISDTQALLKVPGLYRLEVKWRYLVDSTQGCARFDKTNHKLEVTLPTRVSSANPV